MFPWEVIPRGTSAGSEEKGRKPMQGELVSSVLLWAPGVQVLMGSPRKLRAVHSSEFSCQGGERKVFITNSYEAWMGPVGGRRLPSAKAARAGTTRQSPWRWVIWALLPQDCRGQSVSSI